MNKDKILFIVDEKEFLFDGSSFSEPESKNPQNYLNAAVVPSSNLRTYGFKTPKSTTSEKIEIQAEINMYEDGGLDHDVDFSISSMIVPLEDIEDNYVETYAVETSALDEKFDWVVKKYRYLDLIFPPALCYSALYVNSMLEGKNDLFIHIGEKNAYAVIFKNGHYISTRTIASIDELAEKVGVDSLKMKELLSTKGVKDELYEDSEFLVMSDTQEQLSKVVERIAHTIGHKRGIFKLESLDRIFLDFEGLKIPGFLELFNSYGYGEASKDVLDVFVDIKAGMKHHALCALYALCVVEGKIEPVNLTTYERRPSFLKTKVGEFSIVMILAVILSAGYPLYALIKLDTLSSTKKSLEQEVSKMLKLTQKLQIELKEKRKHRDELKAGKDEKISKIKSYAEMLDTLEKFDSDTLARQKMLKDINLVMKKYALSSKKLEFKEPDFVNIQVIAQRDKRDNIAMFIKDLLSLGYSSVITRKVEKNERYYESFVEIAQ